MVKSLYTGVSGLKTHQRRMDVIGNNIANVNTVGFKADVVTFADVYYQTKRSASAATATLGGVNPRQTGYGVRVNSVTANMTQSGYTYSDKTTDLAIDGEGFFQVMDSAGNIRYTRLGDFYIDDNGWLLNSEGYHVLGVTGDVDGVPAGSEMIRITVPDTNANVSSATKLVNGTNVTISVSAPSEYTDMSVSFEQAEFPYATFDNNLLTIYFNKNKQFTSEAEFQDAVNQALLAGGVNLPDDVEVEFEFEEIPNDTEAKAAYNKISDLDFTTEQGFADFITQDPTSKEFQYARFSCKDKAFAGNIILADGTAATTTAEFALGTNGVNDGTWTITLGADATLSDISKAINDAIDTFNNGDGAAATPPATAPEISCTAWKPGNNTEAFVTNLAGNATQTADASITGNLKRGGYDFKVVKPGVFADAYRINFAYSSSLGTTKAVWDENTLTITISDTSSIADVNAAIVAAAKGNDYKLLHFDNIEGLAYQNDYSTNTYKTFADAYPDAEGVQGAPYTPDDYQADANHVVTSAPTPKDAGDVWNSGLRKQFFGGNPSVAPKDGDDSFFTKTAKKLSTFSLENGRVGDEQPLKSISDLSIQNDGTIVGYHDVFGFMVFGRVDLALFDNPNGLAKIGGTNFAETVASGQPRLVVPTKDGGGTVLNGTLEMSNVDLADEFTNMIATQRGYQANSRVVTVSDTMIEELLNLKR